MHTTYGQKNLFVPTSQYFDMSEWSKINMAYTYQNKKIINEVLTEAHNPEKYIRLLELYEQEAGHKLLWLVENTKIKLSNQPQVKTILDFLSGKPQIQSTEPVLNEAVKNDLSKVKNSVQECLYQAQIKAEKIDLIILTGGSTEIPIVKNELCQVFPNADISAIVKLTSVGLGFSFVGFHYF